MHLHEIGAEVRAAREERGLTPAQLARYARVGVRTVIGLEDGSRDIRWNALQHICAVLGLTIEVGRVAHRRPTLYELQAQNDDEIADLLKNPRKN